MLQFSTRRPLLVLLVPAMLALLGGGCDSVDCVEGSGNPASQSRTVGSFDAITLEGGMDLVLQQDTVTSIQIKAEENLLPYITTSLSGSTLTIGSSRCLSPSGAIKVYVSTPSVRALQLEGSGTIQNKGFLRGDTIRCELDGSGEIVLNMNTESLTSDLSGSGEIMVRGTAAAHTASLSGSGKIDALDLATDTTVIEISGSGDGLVWASRKLHMYVTGSGAVYYKGDPADILTTIHGSGSIRRLP